jgi:stage II sporulation protein GA (sporulation sigma-E factor processing peptidase)
MLHLCFSPISRRFIPLLRGSRSRCSSSSARRFAGRGCAPYLSQAAVFYALSLLFGGAVMAVYIFASPPGMLVRGGAVYFDIRPLTLIAGSCGFYIFFTLLSRLTGAPAARCLREIKITVGDKSVSLTALSDTGDTLGDPVSGLPVIVAEYGAVSALIPKEFTRAFGSGGGAGRR